MAREGGHLRGHLLVVDDNKVNRLLLARGLEQQGHTVDFAVNGKEGLERVRSQPFDLILLDIQMPEMDGYQVLKELVSDPELRNIPVVMTSSMDDLANVARCIEMGAEDFLTKPVNPVLLRARINASLEKKWLRDQQQELLRKFATSEVAEDLLTAGFELGGQYVQATVMFSDIRSFSTITESQDPADTIELLNTYYTLVFDAIAGHGGVVNQMIGDGLMSVFGTPVPLDEASHKAVMAALEMVELVDLFNQEQAMLDKVQIQIGVGIATGQVIAGYTGTQHRATYTCVGETVNLAARLEAYTKSLGEPILIDEATRLGLRANVQVVEQDEFSPKGFSDSVKVFTVSISN